MSRKPKAETTISALSPPWAARLGERLKELDWSVPKLAQSMGCPNDHGNIYKYLQGQVKRPRGDVLERIAKAVGMTEIELVYGAGSVVGDDGNVHRLSAPARIRTLGEVAAHHWIEAGADQRAYDDEKESTFPPDPRFPHQAQYDLIVRGTSINRFAPDGYRLRVVDLSAGLIDFNDRDLVIVKRTHGQIIETTAKRVRRNRDKFELWHESNDPQWEKPPLVLGSNPEHPEHEIVEVIAIVLYAYKEPKRQ